MCKDAEADGHKLDDMQVCRYCYNEAVECDAGAVDIGTEIEEAENYHEM